MTDNSLIDTAVKDQTPNFTGSDDNVSPWQISISPEKAEIIKEIKKLTGASKVFYNPDHETIKKLAMENIPALGTQKDETETRAIGIEQFPNGALHRVTNKTARMQDVNFVVGNPKTDIEEFSMPIISREDADKLTKFQEAYLKDKPVIAIDRYIGRGKAAYKVRWIYTLDASNIAGMQMQLSMDSESMEKLLNQTRKPELTLIYTADAKPKNVTENPQINKRNAVIFHDQQKSIVRVLGSDYFGESKKNVLVNWHRKVYEMGGMVHHAGAKLVRVGNKLRMVLVLGLSGTGKTSTSLSKEGDETKIIQDDMVAMFVVEKTTGKILNMNKLTDAEIAKLHKDKTKYKVIGISSENGMFAKIYGLNPKTEPANYFGATHKDAYNENAFFDPETQKLDFEKCDDNGRCTFPMDTLTEYNKTIKNPADRLEVADLEQEYEITDILLLNRDEGPEAITPGMIKFTDPTVATTFYFLGETAKTSATGGSGRTRSPFTQPFFDKPYIYMAQRFNQLAGFFRDDVNMLLQNTGWVRGKTNEEIANDKSLKNLNKVTLQDSTVLRDAVLAQKPVWKAYAPGMVIIDPKAPENKTIISKLSQPAIADPSLKFVGEEDKLLAIEEKLKNERIKFLHEQGGNTPLRAITEDMVKIIERISKKA